MAWDMSDHPELAYTCPVCGSINHVHCSKGCAICDDPNNPHPRYASRFCQGCKRSLCAQCFEDHTCDPKITIHER